jgi:hypothetical protein
VVCDWVVHLIAMGVKESEKRLVLVGWLKMLFWRLKEKKLTSQLTTHTNNLSLKKVGI